MGRAHAGPGPTDGLPDLEEISRHLRKVSDAMPANLRRGRGSFPEDGIDAHLVHCLLLVHRLRKQFLGFAAPDPPWEMMLALLAARLAGEICTLEVLSDGCGTSLEATERWVRKMERRGLALRQDGPAPGAPALVGLTDRAAKRLSNYLREALQISPWLP